MRPLLVLLAVLFAGCGTAESLVAPTDPGQKGWQYVVADQDPSVIVYEGTYPHALQWAHSHTEPTTIYQLPKGKARCQPAKRTCLVP